MGDRIDHLHPVADCNGKHQKRHQYGEHIQAVAHQVEDTQLPHHRDHRTQQRNQGDPSMPFGGFKQSGIGKDLGPEQLEHFLETKGGCIGVIQPDALTIDKEIKHWTALDVPVDRATISPHENSLDDLAAATRDLVYQGADLIVLDCLAFTRDHWRSVRDATHKLVLLPMSIMGKVLDEAYGPF